MTLADKLREVREHLETFKFHSNLTLAYECVDKALAALPDPEEVERESRDGCHIAAQDYIARLEQQRDELAAALKHLRERIRAGQMTYADIMHYIEGTALKRVEEGDK